MALKDDHSSALLGRLMPCANSPDQTTKLNDITQCGVAHCLVQCENTQCIIVNETDCNALNPFSTCLRQYCGSRSRLHVLASASCAMHGCGMCAVGKRGQSSISLV